MNAQPDWLRALGGRRFFMCLGCGIVTTILVWFSKIDPNVYQNLIGWTVGVYVAGDTAQRIKEAVAQ